MLFYSKMRWDLKGMNFDELWDMEGKEAEAAVKSLEEGFVSHLYKVGAEQYVIAIGNSNTMEEFDQYSMGILPMREHLVFEEVWPLEEGFTINVRDYLKARRENLKTDPRFLFYIQAAWDPQKRIVDDIWPQTSDSLKQIEDCKVLGVYRVAGRQRVIAIVDVKSAASLNKFSNARFLQSPHIEKVWALRDYIGFAGDVWKHYKFDM